MFRLKFAGDRSIWVTLFLLTLISLLAVYSSTTTLAFKYRQGDTEHYVLKHAVLIGLGLLTVYVVHRIDYRFFGKISVLLLLTSMVLLLYTLLQGQEYAINRASRWITVVGYSFQPSDLAKFSLMVHLAKVLATRQEDIRNFYRVFLPTTIIILLICSLIAPSNLSTAVLIFGCSMLLLHISGVQLKYTLGLCGLGLILFITIFFLAERATTWKSRILDYQERLMNEQYEPNYQTQQANIAIVNGGWFGRGAGKSLQRNYLPHPYSDFVYALLIEEYGLLGGIVVLALYLILLIRCVAITTVSPTFGALLAAGLSFMLVSQAMVNMGVTVGVLPVTGLTLPLISMGGTSILFTSISLGVILSVSRRTLERQQAAQDA